MSFQTDSTLLSQRIPAAATRRSPTGRLSRTLLRLGRRIWQRPDPRSLEVGFGGERLLAEVRLILVSMLLAVGLLSWIQAPDAAASPITLSFAALAFVYALAVARRVRRPPTPRWLPFASSMTDVLLVTGALVAVMVRMHPVAASNSMVVFATYFLAIGAAALRNDPRICVTTGLAAIVQYGLLLAFAAPDLADPPPWIRELSGTFSWLTQVNRLALLLMATVLFTAIVLRSRRMLYRSTHDALTGLYNRGFFDAVLKMEHSIARRYRTPFTVAILDVDHFKRLNDTYGHDQGDRVLQRLAAVVQQNLRASDMVARYGGEEYAVLLPRAEIDEGARVFEALRQRLERLPMPVGDGAVTTVTVSIGVASWPADAEELDEVLITADRRLYHAKRGGRNRVVARDEEAPVPALEAAAANDGGPRQWVFALGRRRPTHLRELGR